MYLILLTCFIILISASDFCFNEAFNQTEVKTCTIVGEEALQCIWPIDLGDGYKSITMSCDGSKFYDLPIGIDGDNTENTQQLLILAIQNLSAIFNTTITVNCVTRSEYKLWDFYCKNGRNYNVITCNITTSQNETLPVFPENFICDGENLRVSLAFLIGLIITLIVVY